MFVFVGPGLTSRAYLIIWMHSDWFSPRTEPWRPISSPKRLDPKICWARPKYFVNICCHARSLIDLARFWQILIDFDRNGTREGLRPPKTTRWGGCVPPEHPANFEGLRPSSPGGFFLWFWHILTDLGWFWQILTLNPKTQPTVRQIFKKQKY